MLWTGFGGVTTFGKIGEGVGKGSRVIGIVGRWGIWGMGGRESGVWLRGSETDSGRDRGRMGVVRCGWKDDGRRGSEQEVRLGGDEAQCLA